jgi:hypothetical protein
MDVIAHVAAAAAAATSQIYSLVQVANRPHHVNLVATTGNVASTSSALISPQTGAILPAATHRVFIPPNPERFPEVLGLLGYNMGLNTHLNSQGFCV